ncbi:MAG: WecB/TagA/CpsF family glycosyltransferase [Thermaerobacter sp.]|nr:glycosyltransferase [Bacillota bacterium]
MAAGRRVRILGAPVDAVSMDQAEALVLEMARAGGGRGPDGSGAPGATHLVITANPEILAAARDDRELAGVLEEAALVVADGIGVVAAGRILGTPLPERVPGVELLERLLAACAREGLRPFFLGARPEVVEAAAAEARRRFPGLELAGWHHGYFPLDDPAPVEAAAASGAHILFSGMGAGRDLRWLYRNRRRLRVPVAVNVGGSFDVLSGRVRRAPRWMRRAHLEWLYRLLSDPGRWRRQLALPRFALLVLAERLRRAGRPG